jgi:hypothetical protein
MPSTWQIRKWGEQPSMPLENIKFLAFLPVEFRKTARSEYYASVGLILGLQTPLSVVAFLGVPPWAKRPFLGQTTHTAALPCSFRCAWCVSIAWATPRSRRTGAGFHGGGVRFAVFLAGCYNYYTFRSPVIVLDKFLTNPTIAQATKRALAYGHIKFKKHRNF